MNEKDIATPGRTKEILKKHGFQIKKNLGQNFLTDVNILNNIVAAAGLTGNENVIEIGPGIGSLTENLARNAYQVLAFEIDKHLLPILEDTMAPYKNVTILHEDILKVNVREKIQEVFTEERPLKIVANLPYYITTPILLNLLENNIDFEQMTVMMQKEVADRISAKPGTKAYGSLSIAMQYYCEAKVAFDVPKTVFLPQPNVDSAILNLIKREKPAVEVENEQAFFWLIKASFLLRRKTLWNNLQHSYGKEEETRSWLQKSLTLAGIDANRRGETLNLEEFAVLSNEMERLRKLSKGFKK